MLWFHGEKGNKAKNNGQTYFCSFSSNDTIPICLQSSGKPVCIGQGTWPVTSGDINLDDSYLEI